MAMKDMQAEGKTSVKSKIGPQKIFLLKTRIFLCVKDFTIWDLEIDTWFCYKKKIVAISLYLLLCLFISLVLLYFFVFVFV